MGRSLLFISVLLPMLAPGQSLPRQQAGNYEVLLRTPQDGLYAGEEVQIEMRITDTSHPDPVLGNAPVVRATVAASIDLPAMPAMPKYQEVAHAESVSGDYGVHPTFAHGGEYRLSLAITPVGEAQFLVAFPLQVADRDPSRARKATPPAYFLDLTSAPKNPKVGEEVELQLRIRHRDHPKEVVSAFDLQHERYLHMVIVRNDLCCFGHLHPELGPDGVFRLKHVFLQGGEYHVFADVAPRNAGSQILSGVIKVAGALGDPYSLSAAVSAAGSPPAAQSVEGIRFELIVPPGGVPARKTEVLTFRISDAATGKPLNGWEPYLGALGHLLSVGANAASFVHAHPDETQPSPAVSGKLSFLARFPAPGLYRVWVQIQRSGKVITVDFPVSAVDGAQP